MRCKYKKHILHRSVFALGTLSCTKRVMNIEGIYYDFFLIAFVKNACSVPLEDFFSFTKTPWAEEQLEFLFDQINASTSRLASGHLPPKFSLALLRVGGLTFWMHYHSTLRNSDYHKNKTAFEVLQHKTFFIIK